MPDCGVVRRPAWGIPAGFWCLVTVVKCKLMARTGPDRTWGAGPGIESQEVIGEAAVGKVMGESLSLRKGEDIGLHVPGEVIWVILFGES